MPTDFEDIPAFRETEKGWSDPDERRKMHCAWKPWLYFAALTPGCKTIFWSSPVRTASKKLRRAG